MTMMTVTMTIMKLLPPPHHRRPRLPPCWRNFPPRWSYCKRFTLATAWDHLPAGTVLSLPGGQLHAGPACHDFRIVLFWTAHGSAHSVYHPDIQYFDGLLLAELMLPIWRFITVEDRYRFLKHLYPVTQRYKGLWGHFPNNIHFHNFVHELTISKQPVAFMRDVAASPNLAPTPICYPIDGESLVCVSATKLATAAIDGDDDDDGEEAQPIALYRRPNGDVCIQVRMYCKCSFTCHTHHQHIMQNVFTFNVHQMRYCIYIFIMQQQYQNSLEWEGTNIDEPPYRLVLNKGCRFYNGKNGVLYDGDGEPIVCFLVPETTSPLRQRVVVYDLPAYFIDRINGTTAAADVGTTDGDRNNSNNNNIVNGDNDTAAVVVEEQSRAKRPKQDKE
jgi:hypothetical protein